MLVDQGEELLHGLGSDRTHGPQQARDDGAEHFVRLQIQRRQRQAPVAAVQEVGAEEVQVAHRPVE